MSLQAPISLATIPESQHTSYQLQHQYNVIKGPHQNVVSQFIQQTAHKPLPLHQYFLKMFDHAKSRS